MAVNVHPGRPTPRAPWSTRFWPACPRFASCTARASDQNETARDQRVPDDLLSARGGLAGRRADCLQPRAPDHRV